MISTVTQIAEEAIETNKFCAVVNLDVKNAFNTPKWSKFIAALAKLGAPKHVVRVVIEFLRESLLCYGSDDGSETYMTTCGVPRDNYGCPKSDNRLPFFPVQTVKQA